LPFAWHFPWPLLLPLPPPPLPPPPLPPPPLPPPPLPPPLPLLPPPFPLPPPLLPPPLPFPLPPPLLPPPPLPLPWSLLPLGVLVALEAFLWPFASALGFFPALSPGDGAGLADATRLGPLPGGADPGLTDGRGAAGCGAGAPKTVCATSCSGAGSASAAAVPPSAATRASTPPAISAGTRPGRRPGIRPGRRSPFRPARCLVRRQAPRRDWRTASPNAATAACSPHSSRAVAGRAAAASTRASACSCVGAQGPAPWPDSSRSAVASSGDSRSVRSWEIGISAGEPLQAVIVLHRPGPPPRLADLAPHWWLRPAARSARAGPGARPPGPRRGSCPRSWRLPWLPGRPRRAAR
jgi:hypothetical protein